MIRSRISIITFHCYKHSSITIESSKAGWFSSSPFYMKVCFLIDCARISNNLFDLLEWSLNFMEDIGYSNFYPLLQQLLCDPDAKTTSFQAKVFNQPLTLTIIQRQNIMYACDLKHTIQLILPEKSKQTSPPTNSKATPFNRVKSDYYRKPTQGRFNIWEAYNCNLPDLIIADTVSDLTPYTPHFYLGDTLTQLKQTKELDDNDIFLPKEINNKTIEIAKWKIRIVNVSQSVYYAPVLQAITFKIDTLDSKPNFKYVTLILYQTAIKQAMQAMWLRDLRQNPSQKPVQPHKNHYFANLQGSTRNVDRYQSIKTNTKNIDYRQDEEYNYIPLGQQPQVAMVFEQQIVQKYPRHEKRLRDKGVEQKEKEVCQQEVEVEIENPAILESVGDGEDEWRSDEDESSQRRQGNESCQVAAEEEEQEPIEVEEALKNTYLKYIKKKKIRKDQK